MSQASAASSYSTQQVVPGGAKTDLYGDHPQGGISPCATHFSPDAAPSASLVLPGQCQHYPLYWNHCALQAQHAGEGQIDGGSLLQAGEG